MCVAIHARLERDNNHFGSVFNSLHSADERCQVSLSVLVILRN
jgi:hypothetical protein